MKSVSHGNETWQAGDWFAAACANRIIQTLAYCYYYYYYYDDDDDYYYYYYYKYSVGRQSLPFDQKVGLFVCFH
jgi:hypothetical protein